MSLTAAGGLSLQLGLQAADLLLQRLQRAAVLLLQLARLLAEAAAQSLGLSAQVSRTLLMLRS